MLHSSNAPKEVGQSNTHLLNISNMHCNDMEEISKSDIATSPLTIKSVLIL